MRRELHEIRDIEAVATAWATKPNGKAKPEKKPPARQPVVLSVSDLYGIEFPAPEMLIEGMTPMRGASLIVGAAKSGKTLLAVQKAVAVASGSPLFGYYRVLKPGPAMIIEQDDPAGAGSIKTILQHGGAAKELPIYIVPRLPFWFGPELLDWLEQQINALALRLVVLDSFTALRGSRGPGVDIVKAEQGELSELDELAKRLGCAIELIHHTSKGSAALDWSGQAAGSFAMSAATEAQTHISRFNDFDGAAPERLVRIRGRHSSDMELVLRFEKQTLSFAHVLEGGAACMYPLLQQIKTEFNGVPFGPKELYLATGVSRATAHRQIERLFRAGALVKRGRGDYCVTA